MNIIFGSKRLGASSERASNEKYPNNAVITVEGQKGAKKSRRILFNTKAAEMLNLENGVVQQLVFGSVEQGVDMDKQVLVMNTNSIDGETGEMTVYKTSKNKVAYVDSSEKGKAITSTHMCNEIFTFLGIDDSTNIEFSLVEFGAEQVEAYSLATLNINGADELSNSETSGNIETNTGKMTAEEVIDSVQDEVMNAEVNDPIFVQDETDSSVEDTVAENSVEEVSEWS